MYKFCVNHPKIWLEISTNQQQHPNNNKKTTDSVMRNWKQTNTFKLTLFYLSFPLYSRIVLLLFSLSIPEWFFFICKTTTNRIYQLIYWIFQDFLNIIKYFESWWHGTPNRIQLKFPKLSKFKHWIIALLTKCHMMNIYFVCNSLRLLNLNEIFSFFLSSMVWKIRIKYKRNSLNTFFFSVSLEHLHFSQH